jgi:hypothetical protein
MNERIKELAVQSGVVEAHVQWEAAGGDFLEKFAELIIKDCIDMCDEVDRINKYHIEKDFIDPELGSTDCIDVIKSHFGI